MVRVVKSSHQQARHREMWGTDLALKSAIYQDNLLFFPQDRDSTT